MSSPNTNDDRLDVGSSWSLSTLMGLVTLVVVLVCGLISWRHFGDNQTYDVRIATGPDEGVYDAVGRSLCDMLKRREFVGLATPLGSEGSADNMRMLAGGEADLAFVQSDQVIGKGKRVGLIAPLYDELLHILVAHNAPKDVKSLTDLKELRVSIGEQNSGTRVVVDQIVEHLEIEIEKPLGLSTSQIRDRFRNGQLDAAFLLTAVPSPIVNELCDEDLVRFLSLGDPSTDGGLADALSLVFPSYRKALIPIRSYGSQPLDQPVSAISVSALLVASSDHVQPELARQITQALFEHRADLSTKEFAIAEQIREDYSPGDWMISYHPGAVQYYRRDEPPFLVAYAELISLLLTLMVGSFSASLAFRGWLRRRRKNRIDAYYNEIRRHSGDILAASRDDLQTYRDRLAEIRQRAFDDLVDEKLDANESFSIFQDYLRSELMAIEIRLNKMDPISTKVPQ